MFNFSSNTKVQQKFKLSDLLKMVNANKELKATTANIASVTMVNAISEATTALKPSNEVNEIYVIEVCLKDSNIPYEFLKSLDKTIRFQVLFEIKFENKRKFLTTYKTITDEKITQIKTFESDWSEIEDKDMPLVANLTDLYKAILMEIYNLKFHNSENIKEWIQRTSEIDSLQKEFKKFERMMNAESQPKKVFELNEKCRKIYERIKEIEK